MSDNSEKKKHIIKGRVVSNKMNKSITVLVERLVPHPVYGKYVRRSTKLLAHDEENVCQEGDLVSLTTCRPLSKRKTWRLVEVLEATQQ
jgi:small subunit ribosomal protein S17